MNNNDKMVSKKDADKLTTLDVLSLRTDTNEEERGNYGQFNSSAGLLSKEPTDSYHSKFNNKQLPGDDYVQENSVPVAEKNFDEQSASAADLIRQKQQAVSGKLAKSEGRDIDPVPEVKEIASGKKDIKETVAKAQEQAKQQVNEKPAEPQPAKEQVKLAMHTVLSLDDMTSMIIKMFEQHFDIKLSSAICFENVRKLCEADVKNPDRTLYLLENTYRVSTLTYMASDLPIVIVGSIFAEQHRKNILKYVTKEVEAAAQPYDDVLKLRMSRWSAKYSKMQLNDAMTVTPGVTSLSPDLVEMLIQRFDSICLALKPTNKELADGIAGFDENTKNDIIYIYSNWWYFLQAFENVPDFRDYIIKLTDSMKQKLKLS